MNQNIGISDKILETQNYCINAYRFGFNGKIKDDEIDGVTGSKLDFGARIYDSRIGRLLSIDPLAKEFPSESNYSFAGNNPVYYIDKNGEKKVTYITTIKNGKKTTIRHVNSGYVKKVAIERTVRGMDGYKSFPVNQNATVDYDVVEFVTIDVDQNKTFTSGEQITRQTSSIMDFADFLVRNAPNPDKGSVKQGSQKGGNPLIADGLSFPGNTSRFLPTAENPGEEIDISQLFGGRGGGKLSGILGRIVNITKSGFNAGQSISDVYNRVHSAVSSDIFCEDCNRVFKKNSDGSAGHEIKNDHNTPKDTSNYEETQHPDPR